MAAIEQLLAGFLMKVMSTRSSETRLRPKIEPKATHATPFNHPGKEFFPCSPNTEN